MLCVDSFVAARTMSEPAAERRVQSRSVACLLLGMQPRDQHSTHRIGRRGGQSAHLMRIAPASPFTSTTRSFSKSCDQFYLAKMFSLPDISQYSFSNIDIHCFLATNIVTNADSELHLSRTLSDTTLQLTRDSADALSGDLPTLDPSLFGRVFLSLKDVE